MINFDRLRLSDDLEGTYSNETLTCIEELHLFCRPRWLRWMRRPTGDQEVVGSTPAEVGNILSWSWNIFYGHSLPSADSRRAVVSFWRKNVHNTG